MVPDVRLKAAVAKRFCLLLWTKFAISVDDDIQIIGY